MAETCDDNADAIESLVARGVAVVDRAIADSIRRLESDLLTAGHDVDEIDDALELARALGQESREMTARFVRERCEQHIQSHG